jgi:hypothetical protein
MGYRFLVSTPDDEELFELGTVVPALKTLEVEPGLIIEQAPVFQHRVASSRGGHIGFRAGSAPAFHCNHSYHVEAWGTFSNIWFDYLSRLAPEVKERWPHMRISTLAYHRHYGVPTFEIPDNIGVMVALMRSSMQNKQPGG